MTYRDMLFQSNDTRKYLRNNKIMSKFSRDMAFVAFCGPSFILRSQCALCFRVCSISRLFLCAMSFIESAISITSPSMVSLLYDSATEQLTIFVQNFKSNYIVCLFVCGHVVDMSGFFYRYVDMKKRSRRQPYL